MRSNKRAVRYGLHVPVWYRAAGEAHWSKGVTANVSPSGVLIIGELPACTEPITVLIVLTDFEGCFAGCGRITRVPHLAPPNEDSTFAIQVSKFSIESRPVALARIHGLHQEC